jgi:hypothetical protein
MFGKPHLTVPKSRRQEIAIFGKRTILYQSRLGEEGFQMKRIYLWGILFLLTAVLGSAQGIKWPVFFLRYDRGTKFEESEDEEESLLDYKRDKITFRIKEQWSDDFTTNLYTTYFLKRYDESSDSDYWYFYLNPNCIWDITDRVRWKLEFRSKWTVYDGLDSEYESKDLTSLRVKTELTYKVLKQLKIIPSLQSVFDLYDNLDKRQQIYTAGLRFESRINPQVRLNARYRAILRAPLGTPSDVVGVDKHEFGINVSWDPNK